ncbi:glycosyltransferase family 2 protein [Psychroserpens mesophilus]|uniref:glycosyltransferase family 2 protein n=1 Tax=Psychroserpens mesophilus TaxID=325473 RepID=UPI003F4928D6
MKLSVIIPAYNASRFITKSYNSILNQNIENFEIIYVDNNSSDNTLEEIQKLSETDNRVSWYVQKTQGAGPTRNKGLEHAKGNYLYFFDVDDEIYPNALNKMIHVLDHHPDIEAVFGKMMKSDKGISETPKPPDETDQLIIKPRPFWGLQWFSSLKTVVGPPAFLYRKEVFDKIGGYNEALRIGQDTAVDIKLGMTCNVAFLDTYIYLYFKHTTSTIEQFKEKTPRAALQWPRFVKEHLPFYLENKHEIEFGEKFRRQLYHILGKQIIHKKGLTKRFAFKNQLLSEIKSIKPPLLLRIYLSFLALFPFSSVLKFYSYYLVPYIVKK